MKTINFHFNKIFSSLILLWILILENIKRNLSLVLFFISIILISVFFKQSIISSGLFSLFCWLLLYEPSKELMNEKKYIKKTYLVIMLVNVTLFYIIDFFNKYLNIILNEKIGKEYWDVKQVFKKEEKFPKLNSKTKSDLLCLIKSKAYNQEVMSPIYKNTEIFDDFKELLKTIDFRLNSLYADCLRETNENLYIKQVYFDLNNILELFIKLRENPIKIEELTNKEIIEKMYIPRLSGCYYALFNNIASNPFLEELFNRAPYINLNVLSDQPKYYDFKKITEKYLIKD